MIRVEQERLDHPAVEALFRLADDTSRALYPDQDRIGMTMAALLAQDVRFFVARQDGAVIGCGGYVPAGPGTAELKRLFVHPDARGVGAGRALLDAMAELARHEGFRHLRLETGYRAERAMALYRTLGYRDVTPFGVHAADPTSRFMELPLSP